MKWNGFWKKADDGKEKPQNRWPTETAIERRRLRARNLGDIRYFFEKAVVVCLFLLAFFGLVFGIHPVRNKDMQPAMGPGDMVVFFRWDREFYKGDVVVYEADGRNCVGRIVARGGDEVEITEERRLKVNGYFEYEEKIFYDTPAYDERVRYPLHVEDGSYFILADYREGAKDSRFYGTVSRGEIKGKAIAVMRWTEL